MRQDTLAALDAVDWDFQDFNPATAQPTVHGLHWYPAPFPPALVATLLDILGPVQTVLDPFSGSGVTLLESGIRGMEASGGDLNAFAVKLVTSKWQLLQEASESDAQRLVTSYEAFRRGATTVSRASAPRDAGIHCDATGWFTSRTLGELARI